MFEQFSANNKGVNDYIHGYINRAVMILKINSKNWHVGFESICWISALIILFFMSHDNDADASLCMFRIIGFNSCPGCGLGHAIHDALHLRFGLSFKEHWLGIPAILIIFQRIYQLTLKKK